MQRFIAITLSALLVGGGLLGLMWFPALADVNYTQGSGTVIFDFTCFTTKHCSAHANVNSAGTEIFTTGNPAQVGAPASAFADGSIVTMGATTDAAATAGSTGTIAAKLRLMTTQLDTINTSLGANVTNPNSPAAWGIGAYGATLPANGNAIGGRASNAEPTALTDGQTVAPQLSLGGKTINLPYSVKELAVRGSADSTDNAAHTILAAGSGSNKTYVTDWECSNTSASTVTVTFNDSASTKIIIPAGGGNNKSMHIPIVTAAATAFQYTASSGVSTLSCSAQGYYGL